MITNIILFGAKGRMGKEIINVAASSKNIVIKAQIDPSFQANEEGKFSTAEQIKKIKADVAIEFTHAREQSKIVDWAVETKTPLVSGTTGVAKKDMEKLRIAAKKIPILWSPNMSRGVNFILEMLEHFAKIKDFDIEISETHHIHKKDKPSGTALLLKSAIESATKKTIPIPNAIRVGGVFGDHKIVAANSSEEIIIEHRALNRELFASGALTAAQWLVGKPPGLYEMKDID